MKRTFSLRTQMLGLMALLVLLQSLALVLALTISRVFFMLDAEAFRLFDNTASARAQNYNMSVGRLIAGMAEEADSLAGEMRGYAESAGISPDALYLDDDAYIQASLEGTDTLVRLLQNHTVSGAFFVLNGSNADKENHASRSAVYLRNSAPGTGANNTSNYLLEVGPIAVSQRYRIPASINWRLALSMPWDDAQATAYYTRPMEAAALYPRVEMERYGYWSPPVNMLGDGQSVVSYTMPLLDEAGVAFGVVGVEISLALFTQHYLPNTDLPYQNSFYAIACVHGDTLDLGWYIPSGPLAQVYLRQKDALALRPVSGSDLYQTETDELGDMYCSAHPLVMYSQNSPFYEESWMLVGFVPKQILHETSTGVRSILVGSIIITAAVSFVLIILLTFATTRKIVGLSTYVRSLSPYMDIHFTRTGIQEIDELTSAVEMLNRSAVNASKTTSKILELTLMPIGGFEVSSDNANVVLTEYIHTLLGITPGTEVTKEAWQDIYARLVANPAQGYENIYRYTDLGGEELWLRILSTGTDTGTVGIILDASRDIEEHRRLAFELDYDTLTHLYSRVAFKREAHTLIQNQPDKLGAMLFVDLDNLKYMNDTFGHDMGDRLIIRAGELFRLFEQDGGVVSRISGDEFAIYLHGYDTKEEIRQVIDQRLSRNDDYILHTPDGASQRIRFSSGIAFYPEDSDNETDLLKLSDYAMYEAKHNRKGAVFEFNKESYQENAYLLDNREAINRLLDDKLIRFAFQPIVDTHTGEVYAYEALMRPLLDNFKSPLEILTVAAAQSKLGQLERLVMIMALQAVEDHVGALGEAKVFVNSIPSQVLSQEDYLLLERRYAGLMRRIVLEITEAENNTPEPLQQKIAFVRRTGMQLAVDDFGTGYSNEVRVLAMQPDVIKVDIALISGIDQDEDKRQLVSNLISFCHPRGIRLVAEGVERYEELEMLIHLNIDYVQGYYTGRPAYAITQVDERAKGEILSLRRRT